MYQKSLSHLGTLALCMRKAGAADSHRCLRDGEGGLGRSLALANGLPLSVAVRASENPSSGFQAQAFNGASSPPSPSTSRFSF